MVLKRITIDKHCRAVLQIPAFLRDKFGMENGDYADVDHDGEGKIIVIPPKKKGGS